MLNVAGASLGWYCSRGYIQHVRVLKRALGFEGGGFCST